ncbi:thioredoxin family protein [Clostridium sp. NSJ-6]|uniref:Thioredoxin family protein n=1 Tax=Clostridium hominis TaxID=2763036 RepID=A0ABR7D8S6_9CLOT|nr:thioredoxin family protein [Clostridium hominis]MBC5627795.1 thioredoxin family protein [Clostridium hominis]MDU2672936.1 thioredoxin family protein [Clostridium sp.]
MVEMNIKELYEVGTTFETAIGQGTKSERARIPKNYSRINFPEDMINTLVNYDKEINFLVAGEIWCPDFQLNSTVLKKFTELNNNFDMSIISMGRGKKFVFPILGVENMKFPLILVLDKEFNILGIFEERPNVVHEVSNFEDIKLDYYKGRYLIDSAYEFIDIMNKAK